MVDARRQRQGGQAYHAGRTAEAIVERHYEQAGRSICARRWRGTAGEIDLVARDGAEVIFIEVKHSRTHASAAEQLSGRQISRLLQAASEYIGSEPAGQLTQMRFDLALVDGQGRIEIIENALAA